MYVLCDRYLLLAFPQLLRQDRQQHVLEIGCGCGSSLLPVLKANPAARVTATDISPTAVRLFRDAAARAGIAEDRYEAFACDAADPTTSDELLSGKTPLTCMCKVPEVVKEHAAGANESACAAPQVWRLTLYC